MIGQNKYFQIEKSIDPKLIGRGELPLTVKINDKHFASESSSYVVNFKRYFEDVQAAFINVPENIVGEMYQKRDPVDIMGIMPHHPIIFSIVSQKVIEIFEKLQVNKDEYQYKKLQILNKIDPYYFLFLPIHQSSENVNFQKSKFTEVSTGIDWSFPNFESYMSETKSKNFVTKSLCINPDLENNDIIRLQMVKPFFSERIIEACLEENVVGFDVIKGGDFKVNLSFNTLS